MRGKQDECGYILLRKLSYKSILQDGKYKNQMVKTIIKVDNRYLVWVYFSLSKISFIDDILDDLHIPVEFRIKKPGKDLEMYHALNLFLINEMTTDEKIMYFLNKKRENNIRIKMWLQRAKNQDNKGLSKSSLKSINQRNNGFRFDYFNVK